MHKLVNFPGLLACGIVLSLSPVFAQGVEGAASPGARSSASANTAPTEMEARANADVAAASAGTAGAPAVNLPDPHNAGTLAENARTTALATYPWSTPDTWLGRR